MPAYFSIVFELNKSKTVIKDFCDALLGAGLAFKSGFWGFENDSYVDTVFWNQKKLDNDFQLGYTEDYTHNYKQMLFDLSDFTEIRLYIMNNQKTSTFSFHLITPEDDLVEWKKCEDKYISFHNTERMNLLKNISESMWNSLEILAIQTAWECSDCPPRSKDFSGRILPQAEPFCIISKSSLVEKMQLSSKEIGRNGVLLVNENNWNYL